MRTHTTFPQYDIGDEKSVVQRRFREKFFSAGQAAIIAASSTISSVTHNPTVPSNRVSIPLLPSPLPPPPPLAEAVSHYSLSLPPPDNAANIVYDAIVIGGGIGGLAAASVMSAAGKKVLVLEQHDRLGGATHVFPLTKEQRTASFDSGYHYTCQEFSGECR
jgi:hypothetical protein